MVARGLLLVQHQMERHRVHVVGQDLWMLDASIATEMKVLSVIQEIRSSAYRRTLMVTCIYIMHTYITIKSKCNVLLGILIMVTSNFI